MFASKHLALFGALVALLSCNQKCTLAATQIGNPHAPIAADGYYYEQTQYSANKARIEIVRYPNTEAIGRAWVAGGNAPPPAGRMIMAFTTFNNVNGVAVCRMHIVDPRIDYMPQYIGHEFVHCIHGNFHPTQG